MLGRGNRNTVKESLDLTHAHHFDHQGRENIVMLRQRRRQRQARIQIIAHRRQNFGQSGILGLFSEPEITRVYATGFPAASKAPAITAMGAGLPVMSRSCSPA